MNKAKKTRQQIRDEQINYLLGDVEKTLEDYRQNIELKEKQLSDAKKILLSAKQSYDKTVAENKELKAYIESLKQRFIALQQQRQVQFFEKQRGHYQQQKSTPKKYKKVVYDEESESEPEPEQEEDEESEKQLQKEKRS